MPIATINIATSKKSTKTKQPKPALTIEQALISAYIIARAAEEKASSELSQAKDGLVAVACPLFFKECADRGEMLSSVELRSADDENQKINMAVQNKYPSSIDREAAEALFKSVSKDAGEFCEETVCVKFDSKIFTQNGTFNKSLYLAMSNAIAKVAKDHGVENPLSVESAVKVKPDFHAKRATVFTSEQNQQIQRVIPATVQLTVK